jgi:hypothetical protein
METTDLGRYDMDPFRRAGGQGIRLANARREYSDKITAIYIETEAGSPERAERVAALETAESAKQKAARSPNSNHGRTNWDRRTTAGWR